jgi:beta-aspartyl-peptidase (threonine type)
MRGFSSARVEYHPADSYVICMPRNAVSKHTFALVLHGGAWDIPDDLVEPHRKGMRAACQAGWDVLHKKGSAIDAVEQAIIVIEQDDTFDAGRGSFINAAGEVELDASIMNGATFQAGAVAAVQNIPHPITLARAIMEQSEHVLLVGMGASRFAREHKIATCSKDDLITLRELERWRTLQADGGFTSKDAFRKKRHPSGTVGAVALDCRGNVAAGTSTGGTPNKFPGRVGDSPLIGCGTYADNSSGAVSTTGWGEAMIKVVMAKTVIDLMDWHQRGPLQAAEDALKILEKKTGGYGGIIALNPAGDIGISFNTPRMARAYRTSSMRASIVDV